MIHENVELHNVAEVISCGDGLRLQRVPETVRACLNQGAQYRVLQPDNCELRFASESDREVRVTLSSEGEADIALFHGMFDSQVRHVIGREPTTITIGQPNQRLQDLDRKWWGKQPFSPHVRRLVFGGRRREPIILHDIEGADIRPPQPDEVPALRYLAYGTSITHGFFCEEPNLSYVGQTARGLGADLINLGVGGACHCEAEFADHIAARTDWDIATLSLSVNMQGFALDEFRKRVDTMVNTVAGADTSRPVVCITLFPYYRDFGLSYAEETYGGSPEDYRQVLRDVVQACPHPNVHLIEGPELLTDMSGMADDLIHPAAGAMIEIGANLSTRLKALNSRTPIMLSST